MGCTALFCPRVFAGEVARRSDSARAEGGIWNKWGQVRRETGKE